MNLINRRHFLKGLGVCLPLPMMASLAPRSYAATRIKSSSVKRFVCVAPDYGIYRASLAPKEAGPISFTKYSSCLKHHAKDISIFSGLDHPDVGGGHGCSATLLNGMKKTLTGGDMKKMQSLDMLMAENFGADKRYPLLNLGNGAPITCNRKGISVPKISSPKTLWQKLFIQDNSKQIAKRKHSISDEGSILDGILEDAKRMNKRLAKHDKDKFEEYLNSVRDTEKKLSVESNWLDKPKPKVKVDPFKMHTKNGDLLHDFELFYEIMALALQTDSSRFLTFQMGGGNGFLPVPGVTGAYHMLTHHGHEPDKVNQLSLIDQWRYRHFSRFLDLMKTIKDEEGQRLLDSTIVLFGSGMADASTHSNKNSILMVAGGGFKHGLHHKMSDGKNGGKDTAMSNLYVTFLQQMGMETDHFSTSNGNLNSELAGGLS